ncbi:hypothetical protein FGSG_13951 [Fusarium graminearum PH-1]|uniref:Chromosome 3, complete genome n=1 Tax=Gibberella zeae (strain ATCC MYA-4620 / CBS 123657 / FGSC 9075 / NRRL 31084 / PH-1) TaxID=229533 RepID=I1SAS0_GIBZE|nr:hypothetical protein FGSG_13951 [Fusarium graminearum PH-1]ESU18148.1 hypothetical protein FGSG_13951 [Fusarium graminearum PH-1]CEF87725.1 unnamed protein product [Fusarium graminearum]|eukprot:XP_011325770.1 hypothetical protein FGSG_13951 [Fusarium graminearum PH-1]
MEPVKQSDLKGLVDRGNLELSLICNSIKIGTLCGDLDSEHRVHKFNEYLNNPLAKEEERHMWRPETTPPFKILDATKDPIYSIPLHHLETDIEFLFHEIQVPDIISRLETGECRFCNSKGVYQQYEASFVVSFLFFTFLPIRHSDCYFDVLCPLCIGLDYAEMCFYERCSCLRTEKIMPDEEYYNRVKKRFKELGYALL